MPRAFSPSIDISETFEDIAGTKSSLKVLRRRIQQEIDEAVRTVADDFRKEVKKQIQASDLDNETGELLNSWQVRPRGVAHYQVRSTADHAIWMEVGTGIHGGGGKYEISGNPFLYFEPEPGTYDLYPKHTQMDDGHIKISEVEHPGSKAYNYFSKARYAKDWEEELDKEISRRVDKVLKELGLR